MPKNNVQNKNLFNCHAKLILTRNMTEVGVFSNHFPGLLSAVPNATYLDNLKMHRVTKGNM